MTTDAPRHPADTTPPPGDKAALADGAGVFPCNGRIAVIDALRLLPARTLLSDQVELVVLTYSGLTPDRIGSAAPQLLAAPLVGTGYDITDVIALARKAGYSGPVAALTRPLSVPADLRATILAAAGDQEVFVVQVAASGDIVDVTRVTSAR